jgi:hypothetical protein
MKKLLLIGLILAILILAMPQGVSALDTPTTAVVNAGITPVASISAAFIGPWTLGRGENTLPATTGITVTVDANSPWSTKAEDLSTPTNHVKGHMQSTTVSTNSLNQPLYINGGVLTGSVDLVTNGAAQTSTPLSYALAQQVVDTDDANQAYTITLTFTLTTP